MDALSDVLRVVRLGGGVFLEAEFTAPWCISGKISSNDCQPFIAVPRHVIATHFVVSGSMQLQLAGSGYGQVTVHEGEIVLLPHNDPHVFGSGIVAAPVPASAIIQPPQDGGLARIVHGGGGAATRLVCGFLASDAPFSPLLLALPPVLKLDVRATPSGAWIESSFRFAASEIAAGRPGSSTVIAKLSELLFVEAVNHYVAGLPADQCGWLSGLRDRNVGRALGLLHERAAQPWSTESLAQEVGMSRSAFAERFTALVGQPPMQYLTLWRMHLAARQLRDGASVARAAFAIGYESEAAFSRAFKRQFGVAPGAWRRAAD